MGREISLLKEQAELQEYKAPLF